MISDGRGPVLLPADLETAAAEPGRALSLTLGEGAIVAPQPMSDSFLDLQGKDTLTVPWDIHAAKLVECASCHFAPNNPARSDEKRQALRYVTADPRRQSTAEFLLRPDHRLAMPGCPSCHDALAAHEFLPYRARHMEVIACQTCHIASSMGTAAELVDGTVSTLAGGPVVHYRNMDRRAGEALNAAFLRPLRPLLVERVEGDGARRVAPVNLVSRFGWLSGSTHAVVPTEKVAEAFLESGRYAAPVLAAFDRNGDGQLDDDELRLDTPAKTALIASRLSAAGVVAPVIAGTLETHPLTHGVSARSHALRACDDCHTAGSWLSEAFPIVPFHWHRRGKPPPGSRLELRPPRSAPGVGEPDVPLAGDRGRSHHGGRVRARGLLPGYLRRCGRHAED